MLRLPERPGARDDLKLRFVAKACFPLTYIALAIWYSFLVLGLLTSSPAASPPAALAAVLGCPVLTVVWIGPNVLRVACLHFISSNMHYYGDVEEGNVVQQTQVLNRWWLAPLQRSAPTSAAPTGSTTSCPVIRSTSASSPPAAHRAMRENGVRFNDLGTFRRANRLGEKIVSRRGGRSNVRRARPRESAGGTI